MGLIQKKIHIFKKKKSISLSGGKTSRILTGIRHFNFGDVERPRTDGTVAIVSDADTRVSGDDVLLHRQYGRQVIGDPRYLRAQTNGTSSIIRERQKPELV